MSGILTQQKKADKYTDQKGQGYKKLEISRFTLKKNVLKTFVFQSELLRPVWPMATS